MCWGPPFTCSWVDMPQHVAPCVTLEVRSLHSWNRQDVLSLCTHNPSIYQVLYEVTAVNSCFKKGRWRERGGVHRSSEHLWKSCLVTNRCLDLWPLYLIEVFSQIHKKVKVNWYFSDTECLSMGDEKTQSMFSTSTRVPPTPRAAYMGENIANFPLWHFRSSPNM